MHEGWPRARPRAAQGQSFPGEPVISNKVFVGNLSFDVTREELVEAMNAAGKVVDAKIPTDRESGRPRGFAFVEFETDEMAQKCISLLNGRDLKGRALRINEAENRPPRPAGERPSFGGPRPDGFGKPRPGGGGGGGGGFGGPRPGGFGGGGGGPRFGAPPPPDFGASPGPTRRQRDRGTDRSFERPNKKREGGGRPESPDKPVPSAKKYKRLEDFDDYDE